MLAWRVISFAAVFAAMPLALRGATDELTVGDIAKIRSVCQSLLGAEAWRAKEIFARELAPYARSKKALAESSQVECSIHCGGSLPLRGGGDIWYGFSNQPVGVMHRVDSVAFHVHGKRVFATGPGLEYYPYPYYDREAKKP